jgi:CHAT domain-containing protein
VELPDLHQLPLHALTINNVPFIERWAVAYAPSASILTYMLKRKRTVVDDKALVMSYTSKTKEKAGFTNDAQKIAKLFKQAVCRYDQEATSDMLRAQAPTSKFIHLLCHGTFDEKNALNSGVFLGDMPAMEEEGTRFSAQDWLQLRLKADVLMLSACETGKSKIYSGDALVGLAQSLLYAGAQSLILPLWSVSHTETTAWAMGFYGHLLGKTNISFTEKIFAFQQATLNLRKDNPDPFYWAPFVLIGDWK